MNKFMISISLLALIIMCTIGQPGWADDNRPEQRSYYQHTPNKVQQPATIWSPIITERKDGTVYKSYYQLPDSKVTPKGTIWNPLISTEVKKGK